MPVKNVQRRDEELMRVLLLVAGQVLCMRPHQVQQLIGNVRVLLAAVKLIEPEKN